ncbi:MAG: tetratricopeptide repeat protein, partial [Cyclobacteriaceae bacterium]|nr:tetratricopeptide repeat protein [Cyclobacteriaceae bacterium]
MRLKFSGLVLFLLLCNGSYAQLADTTLAWADRLLLQEVHYPVASRLTRTLGAPTLKPLNRLIDAALLSRDYPLADSLLRQSNALAGSGSDRERAYDHFNRARLLYEQSDYVEAARHGSSARQMLAANKMADPGALLQRNDLQLAKIFIQQRQLRQAQPLLTTAFDFFNQDSVRYAIPLAQTCFAMGLWHKINGDWQSALNYYTRAARLFEGDSHERYYDLGRCYNNLGTVYNEQGNYGQAKAWYVRALQVKRRYSSDSLSLAVTYNNMGTFYSNFGNLYQAREHYEKSLALLNPRDVRTRERQIQFLNNYANLLMEVDEQDAAERNLRRSLQLLREAGVSGEPALAPSLSLAGLLTARGELASAEELLESCGRILADSQSTSRMVALWHLRHADLLNHKGDLAAADEAYGLAEKFAGAANSLLASEVFRHRGELALKQMKENDALHYFHNAYTTIKPDLSVNDPQFCINFNLLGSTFLQKNDLDSALHYLQ